MGSVEELEVNILEKLGEEMNAEEKFLADAVDFLSEKSLRRILDDDGTARGEEASALEMPRLMRPLGGKTGK